MKYRVRVSTSYRGTSESTVDAESKIAAMERALKDWATLGNVELYNRRVSDGGLGYSAKAMGSLFPSGRDYADISARIV